MNNLIYHMELQITTQDSTTNIIRLLLHDK